MEQYYYNHMDKQKQAAYHAMLQGIRNLTDEFQIPALDVKETSRSVLKPPANTIIFMILFLSF